MTYRGGVKVNPFYRVRALASYNADPTQDVWYTVMQASDVMIAYATVKLDLPGIGAADDAQMRATLDGVTLTDTGNQNDGEVNYFYVDLNSDGLDRTTTIVLFGYGVPVYARSAKIEVRSHAAAADIDGLISYVRYYQL